MDPSLVQNFREYIESSTSSLQTTLEEVLIHETLQYDIIYEAFLKIIENFKINMLNQMKLQLFPGDLVTEHQKEHVLLNQMKFLVSNKIKNAIEKLNTETDNNSKQKLIEYIGVLNESLQKIESNLASNYESNRYGSTTSRTDLSMILPILPRLDANKDIDASQMTPIPHRIDQYQDEGSTISKLPSILGLGDNNVNSFKPTAPPMDFQAILNLKTKPELPEGDNKLINNTNGIQGKSLSEMFDACLSSIKNNNEERNKKNLLNKQNENKPESSNLQLPPLPTQNSTLNPQAKMNQVIIEKKENRKSSPKISIENRKNIKEELGLKTELLALKAGEFCEYIDKFLKRRCLNKWKYISFFPSQKYEEDEFDLLHGNIDGIEGMEGLDLTERLGEDPMLRKVLTPIENREDIISSDYEHDNLLSGPISFYEINFQETERNNQAGSKSSVQINNQADKENDTKSKFLKKASSMESSSPRALNAGLKKPVVSKPHITNTQEKIKEKTVSATVKSPIIKKETEKVEKTKTELRSSSIKGPNKGSTVQPKVATSGKTGLPPSNKENNFAFKASPTKQLKKSLSGTNK